MGQFSKGRHFTVIQTHCRRFHNQISVHLIEYLLKDMDSSPNFHNHEGSTYHQQDKPDDLLGKLC
jgi:hypothetical protein